MCEGSRGTDPIRNKKKSAIASGSVPVGSVMLFGRERIDCKVKSHKTPWQEPANGDCLLLPALLCLIALAV